MGNLQGGCVFVQDMEEETEGRAKQLFPCHCLEQGSVCPESSRRSVSPRKGFACLARFSDVLFDHEGLKEVMAWTEGG